MNSSILKINNNNNKNAKKTLKHLIGHTNENDIPVEMLSQTHSPKLIGQVRSDKITNRLYLEAMESGEIRKRVWLKNTQQNKGPRNKDQVMPKF